MRCKSIWKDNSKTMDRNAALYLAVTIGLFVVFALIVIRTLNRKRKDTLEAPKYRMLDDE